LTNAKKCIRLAIQQRRKSLLNITEKIKRLARFQDLLDLTIMENGELRIYIRGPGNTAAIYSKSPDDEEQGWQNAHYHMFTFETYIVVKGKVIYAHLNEHNELVNEVYEAGEMFTVKPNIPHNILMFKSSAMFVIKHGKNLPHPSDDWFGDDKLQALTKEAPIEE